MRAIRGRVTSSDARAAARRALAWALPGTLIACLVAGAATAGAVTEGRYVADSYYITGTSTAAAGNLGCDQAEEDSLFGNNSAVILDFGAQMSNDKETELPGHNHRFATNAQIEALTEAYAEAYFECLLDPELSTRVAIGTNTSGSVTSAGGKTWAGIVATVADKVLESPEWTSHVSIWGGDDIELAFSDASPVKAWAKKYSASTDSPYIDYGAAEGCSETTHKNSKCENVDHTTGWTQKAVYQVSWEVKGANPAPEIYHAPGDAKEWTQIDLYKEGKMRFIGVLTDREAEVEVAERERENGEEVEEPGNTPIEGYDQLNDDLEAAGVHHEIPFSLEIFWQKESHASVVGSPANTTGAEDVSAENESERPARIYAACMAPFAGYPPEKLEAIEDECRVRRADSEKFTVAEEAAHKAEMRKTSAARRASQQAQVDAEAPAEAHSALSASHEGPFGSDHGFAATGHWTGEVDGRWYEVYAGAKVDPVSEAATRSELLVFSAPAAPQGDESSRLLGTFAPPGGGTEPLTITGANGDVLEVQTSTGETLRFDVATQSFLST